MVKAPTPLMSSLTQRRRCHGLPMKMLKGVNTSVCRFMLNSKYMYRMVKTTDRAPASSGIIMMICYLTFVTHEPKNDQLKDRGRSRFYQEKYYQYGAILQGVKYIENEQCS
ncbi:uncharacterized protein LOC110894119 isoform X8 [Helianthus annuus]|uniref:uncharacterized protein LOC110894119 isoform X8 n=1 Tax=Helianthus annuus TaxID=4232 RepID=UPI001652DAAB|nr:uncharacterized protein LOC110894119 isoform X8 [Helianthus annuus]